MDLGSVSRKLQRGAYAAPAELVKDVELVRVGVGVGWGLGVGGGGGRG